ncbi:hypothetical protein M8818_006506 [Zalaria obscura]|uniref:Uncharacterized protein n=1 Tax=Zalaria obscura TaxID=2024903 RepID=A0ACC3S6W8_9PEZI
MMACAGRFIIPRSNEAVAFCTGIGTEPVKWAPFAAKTLPSPASVTKQVSVATVKCNSHAERLLLKIQLLVHMPIQQPTLESSAIVKPVLCGAGIAFGVGRQGRFWVTVLE